MMPHLPVPKTYKLYIGGSFPRSESGRSYEVEGANVARASRKDVRDAVRAARGAARAWAAATAYNRGQVLYRIAEMLDGRRAQFAALAEDEREVDEAVDRWIWYAGWADKLAQVLGSSNPVAGPYFNFTVPEPVGVVGIVAPDSRPLGGLVARLAPVVVGGNAAVVVASESRPLAAITLAEVLATSDVPGGVVNIVTGRKDELAPVLASHLDVDALDLAGEAGDGAELERLAAENVKRVVRSGEGQSPWHAAAFLEMKTVWHPIGV
ncbi:MAG: aldehyde dehydrogenase family protein [Thermoleophilia bacterium]|nr:aldehyde dehydrogenase family protein [Thermoleophilia bacterium]